LDCLQRLMAAQILFQHNLKILHWNVIGLDFDPVHELLGGYYEYFNDLIDDTAEFCKSLSVNVISLHEAMEILENDDIAFMSINGSDSFVSKDCFEKVGNMFDIMIKLYDMAFTYDTIPASIVNKMQESQQWFRKESHFKNRQRLR